MNPTGTTYLQANTSYVWADGDIYQIPQADSVEGAATGASFSGLGVENQPHQLLLNKIQLTHKNQLVDETNIGILQVFEALFTSALGLSGWIKIGLQDTSKGQVQGIVQWGFITSIPASGALYTFPIAFPNACLTLVLGAMPLSEGGQADVLGMNVLLITQPTKTNFQLMGVIADSGDSANCYWLALGY